MGSDLPLGQGRTLTPRPMPPEMEPTTIGRYELVSELGRGAMGVVYKATDPILGRSVAIKTINMALERDGIENYEARFYQEARAAGGLSHPNIVTIYDVGKNGDIAYMAMEFVEGVELTGRELLSALERHGIRKISPLGEKFNHDLHEALFEVPTSDAAPGTVVQVLEDGYVIHDRLLRAAKVGVAKALPGAGGNGGHKVDTTA